MICGTYHAIYLNKCIFDPGKVFGVRANYIIAEVEFHEGEDLEEELEAQREQDKLEQEVRRALDQQHSMFMLFKSTFLSLFFNMIICFCKGGGWELHIRKLLHFCSLDRRRRN